MSLRGVLPFVLDFLPEKRIEVEVSQAQLTGDAGLLPIRQLDEAIRLTERFGAALAEGRTGDVRHSNLSMVRQRIYGIRYCTVGDGYRIVEGITIRVPEYISDSCDQFR